jgi:tRNA/rRNA methyltransferase
MKKVEFLVIILEILMTLTHTFAYRIISHKFLATRRNVSGNKVDAYLNAKSSEISMPCIILVNPFLDANVGSISRAMLNFGLHELRIVNPRCDILSETATTLAVGSVEILKNAKTFNSLEECIKDLEIVVATTARKRTLNQIQLSPSDAAQEIVTARSNGTSRAGIMFGRERDGLNTEELALANRRVAIPSFDGFPVLNMAQAVNILAYECWIRRQEIASDAATGLDINNSNINSDVNECKLSDFKYASASSPSPSFSRATRKLLGEHRMTLASSHSLNHFVDRLIAGSSRGGCEQQQPLPLNDEIDASNAVSRKEFMAKNDAAIRAIFLRVRRCC